MKKYIHKQQKTLFPDVFLSRKIHPQIAFFAVCGLICCNETGTL